MEKKRNRVRNIVADDVDVVIDVFEYVLCQRGIDYVHVDNEIHCLDKIFRFYSFDEYKELVQLVDFFARATEEKPIFNYEELEFKRVDNDFEYCDAEVKAPCYTKKILLKNNKDVTDKLHQDRGRAERIINRKRCDL